MTEEANREQKIREFHEKFLSNLSNKCKTIYSFGIKILEKHPEFMKIVHKYNKSESDYIDDNMYITVNYKMCLARDAIHCDLCRVFERNNLKILDIGPGIGIFAFISKTLGHSVVGLDIENLQEKVPLFFETQTAFDLNIVHHTIKPFEKLPSQNEKLDIITMFSPHFYNPKDENFWRVDEWTFFMENLAEMLHDTGRIIMRLNAVDAHPEYKGFGTRETQELFEKYGAKISGIQVVIDDISKIKEQ